MALTGAALAATAAGAGRLSVAAAQNAPQATPGGAVPPSPSLEWLGTLTAQLGPLTAIGATPMGTRLIAPVVSGTIQGPNLNGTLIGPSGDWLLVRSDDVGQIDVRGTIETDDGALIYVTYRGYLTRVMELLPRWANGEVISPYEHYFVTTPYFETAAPNYDWLQRTVTIGMGSLTTGGVKYELFTVG